MNETKPRDSETEPGEPELRLPKLSEDPLNTLGRLLSTLAHWAWANVILPSLSEALSALIKAIAARMTTWASARLAQGGVA